MHLFPCFCAVVECWASLKIVVQFLLHTEIYQAIATIHLYGFFCLSTTMARVDELDSFRRRSLYHHRLHATPLTTIDCRSGATDIVTSDTLILLRSLRKNQRRLRHSRRHPISSRPDRFRIPMTHEFATADDKVHRLDNSRLNVHSRHCLSLQPLLRRVVDTTRHDGVGRASLLGAEFRSGDANDNKPSR